MHTDPRRTGFFTSPSIASSRPPTPSANSTPHIKYRPDIDGLRAIAVLMVVGFHAFPGRIAGGFIGVDVFFVISGFLISTILLGDLRKGRFSLATFYLRRMRRIFPALIVVMLACLAGGWLLLLRDEYQALGNQVASGAAFVANLLFWHESGYFDRAADFKPLLHLWSLGIGEQFYFVWPLMLWAAWRYLPRRLPWLLLGVGTASFAFSLFLTERDATAAFYSPVSRFWELLAGAGLAWLMQPGSPARLQPSRWQLRWRSALVWAGAATLALGLLLVTRNRAFPGAWALLPVVGAAAMIAAGPQNWLARHVLGQRWLVGIGLISFPLYLWHWPLLAYVRIVSQGDPTARLRLVAVGLAFVLAWLTRRFVERPIRSGNSWAARRPAAVLGSVMAGTFALGVAVLMSAVLPRNADPALQPILAAAADWDYPGRLTPMRFMGQTFYRADDGADVTLLVGDSHIEQYGPRMAARVAHDDVQSHSVVFATAGGCPFMPRVMEDSAEHQNCEPFRRAAFAYIDQPEVKTVVVGGCWNCYFIAETASKLPGEPAYDYYHADAGGKRENFRGGQGRPLALQALEQELLALSKRRKVYLLLDNPMGPAFDPKSYLDGSRLTGVRVREAASRTTLPSAAEMALNQEMKALAARIGVEVIEPVAALCRGGVCDVLFGNGQFIYRDNHHLRPSYVHEQASYLDKVLATGP
jgi:peptidoglycan/LPS O-acetylase OafA/YrhL